MPKKSLKGLAALFRAGGATTRPEIASLVESLGWRVVLREGAMEVLKGPGGTCVVHTPGEAKEELQTLRVRAIAADGDPAGLVELPRDEEGETQ